MHVSYFKRFGTCTSARIFLPLRMPCCSGSYLRSSSEEVIPSEIARYASTDAKEEETIFATAKALNGEDIPTPMKRGRPSRRGKTSALGKKNKSQKTTKKKQQCKLKLGRIRIHLEGARLRGRNVDSDSGRDRRIF